MDILIMEEGVLMEGTSASGGRKKYLISWAVGTKRGYGQ